MYFRKYSLIQKLSREGTRNRRLSRRPNESFSIAVAVGSEEECIIDWREIHDVAPIVPADRMDLGAEEETIKNDFSRNRFGSDVYALIKNQTHNLLMCG